MTTSSSLISPFWPVNIYALVYFTIAHHSS
uniref:Uncharacterized protein n=1 Tax=Arundo donax TaxID=35708 RepID=A0A0A9DP15_ARUDO